RQDNADLRLTQKGYDIGLVSEERYANYLYRRDHIEDELNRVAKIQINPTEENNKILQELGSQPLKNAMLFSDLIRRPELSYESMTPFDPERKELREDIIEQVETTLKYKGY